MNFYEFNDFKLAHYGLPMSMSITAKTTNSRWCDTKALADFDLTKLVKTRRPQLDQVFDSRLPAFSGTTVLHTPTWEGENEAKNYSSLVLYGECLVSTLVLVPELRVVYKPHPRIFASLDVETENILNLFEDRNVLATDISSVGLELLYRHPQKPLILAERRNDLAALHEETPISRCSPGDLGEHRG